MGGVWNKEGGGGARPLPWLTRGVRTEITSILTPSLPLISDEFYLFDGLGFVCWWWGSGHGRYHHVTAGSQSCCFGGRQSHNRRLFASGLWARLCSLHCMDRREREKEFRMRWDVWLNWFWNGRGWEGENPPPLVKASQTFIHPSRLVNQWSI